MTQLSSIVHPAVPVTPKQLAEFCDAYGIRRLALFGSALRGTMDDESDIDLLVEFRPQTRVGFFELIHAEIALSRLLGRPVDLNTAGFLSAQIRESVMREALILYEG
jgi:predicted nucleotidyltransferase